MAETSLRSLLTRIKFDQELKLLLRDAECPADVVQIGNSLGFQVTNDQVEDAIKSYGIPRGNLYFLLNILMYDEGESPTPQPDTGLTNNEKLSTKTLYIKGTGYDFGGVEVECSLFDDLKAVDPAEYGSLLRNVEFDIDESAPEFPPVLILRDNRTGVEACLNDGVSIEDLGIKIDGDYPLDFDIDIANNATTQSVAKVEKLKGIWGKFDIKGGDSFDLAKLSVEVRKHVLGKGEYQKVINTCSIYYDDMDLDEDVVETRGVSIEYFIE